MRQLMRYSSITYRRLSIGGLVLGSSLVRPESRDAKRAEKGQEVAEAGQIALRRNPRTLDNARYVH